MSDENPGKSRMPTLLGATLLGVAAIATGGIAGIAMAAAGAGVAATIAATKRNKDK